jgi:hypothetical protein
MWSQPPGQIRTQLQKVLASTAFANATLSGVCCRAHITRRCEQGRGATYNLFTHSPVLGYDDTVIGLSEGKLIQLRCSRNVLRANLKSNPDWPLIEEVSPKVNTTKVRQHKCGQVKGIAIRHRKRIIHRTLNACKVTFWASSLCIGS